MPDTSTCGRIFNKSKPLQVSENTGDGDTHVKGKGWSLNTYPNSTNLNFNPKETHTSIFIYVHAIPFIHKFVYF